jgi:hypothetical protein
VGEYNISNMETTALTVRPSPGILIRGETRVANGAYLIGQQSLTDFCTNQRDEHKKVHLHETFLFENGLAKRNPI